MSPSFAKPPSFSEETVHVLRHCGSEERVAAGGYLWQEGEPGDHVVLLLAGTLEVIGTGFDTGKVLNVLAPVSLVGELACLEGVPRSAAVRVSEDAQLVRIPGQAFRAALSANPTMMEELFAVQAGRIRQLNQLAVPDPQAEILDPVTGLYVGGFMEVRVRLEAERAARSRQPLLLVAAEPDGLAAFRRERGDEAADRVLAVVAEASRWALHRADICGRFRGDALLLLLYGAGPQEAMLHADRLRDAAARARLHATAWPSSRLSLSIGVAGCPLDAASWPDLERVVTARLEQAQRAGGNRVVSMAS